MNLNAAAILSLYPIKMNFRSIYRVCKLMRPAVIARNKGTYRIIGRPDPTTMKMPDLSKAPSLMEIIKEKIRLNGPLTVAEYMHIVVTNPTEGYYLKRDAISQSGDFVTSPEISQLFGEMVGIWFLAETQKMSSGKPLQLVELGPGNGTLMSDILRVLYRYGYRAEDMSIHFVEISETMAITQATRLCISHRESDITLPYNREGETAGGIKVYWYNDLKKVPTNFSWFIAHEFFDVLPIHKFVKTDDGWRELLINLDETGLHYRISAKETAAAQLLIRPPLDTGDRTELEISARSLGIARQLAERVDSDGGIALIADYGHEGEKGDTFRAFHKHQVVDPLKSPGQCDLTADVDFLQLKLAAGKTVDRDSYALVFGPVKQKEFLERMQAPTRLQVLLDNAKCDEDKENIRNAYNMLVDPDKMGDRFKFMAYYPSTMEEMLNRYPPLGFAAPGEPQPK